jgi:hypothetical protein
MSCPIIEAIGVDTKGRERLLSVAQLGHPGRGRNSFVYTVWCI